MLSTWLRKGKSPWDTARRASRPPGAPRGIPCRPRLETLEDRRLPSTLTVLNTSDSGPGSLRAEIASAQPGDIVTFDPSLDGQSINLTSAELTIDMVTAKPVSFTVVGSRNGLPQTAALLVHARPKFARPQYVPDETVTVAHVAL